MTPVKAGEAPHVVRAARADYTCDWLMDRRLVRVWASCGCQETFQAVRVDNHFELGDSTVTPCSGRGCQFFTFDASAKCASEFLAGKEVASGNKGLRVVPAVKKAAPSGADASNSAEGAPSA